MKFRYVILFCLPALLTTACDRDDAAGPRLNGDPVLSFEEDDEAMNSAIAQARASLAKFVTALENRSAGNRYLLKVKIEADGYAEHIWLESVSYLEDEFTGFIANEPHSIRSVQAGSKYKCSAAEVSDWAVLDGAGEILSGAYTIKVMERARATGK